MSDERGKRTGGRKGGQGQRGQGRDGQDKKGQGKASRGKGSSQRRGRTGPDPDDTVAQLSGPLRKVLERLPETQRRVLELRMGLVDGHPKNLTETAETLGMTMQEAKQVEQRAFEHIREAVPLGQLQKLLKP